MTLLEMSAQYADRAAVLRDRITVLRGQARQETDMRTVRAASQRCCRCGRRPRSWPNLPRTIMTRGGAQMNRISLDAQGGQWLADMASWARESAPDNNEQLERLRRNLHLARQQALTERQRQVLELYYDRGLTMGQIAIKLHLNRSTISRTLRRAKERLYRCLRYSL